MLLGVLCAAFILFNGSQKSEQSNARSDVIVQQVKTAVHADDSTQTKYTINRYVRKSAHVIEYALFGFFAGLAVGAWKIMKGRMHVAAAIASLLALAVTDEFIQSFQNRTALVEDIVLDAGGGLTGIGLALLICGVFLLIRMKRNAKKKDAAA